MYVVCTFDLSHSMAYKIYQEDAEVQIHRADKANLNISSL